MKLKDLFGPPELDEVILSKNGQWQIINEDSKRILGDLERNIGIDHPTHGAGQTHAHVYGRKGNEIGVVKRDGSSSHGSKFRLKKLDVIALKNSGFKIPKK